MMRKFALFLTVMCFSAGFAQAQSFSEEEKDDECSSYSGLLNLVDTQRPGRPAKKTIIIHNSRRYIIEFAYTLKITTHGTFNPIAKTQEITSQSERDSLSFYFLMDLKDKLLYIFDLDKTLIGADSLKNKGFGVFFDVFEHAVNNDFYREITEDSKVIAEKDTLMYGKRYKAVHIAHQISDPDAEISSVHYVDSDYRADFPLYSHNVLGKGFHGILGGSTLYVRNRVVDEKLVVFESGLPEEDLLLFQELLAKARKSDILPELGGFRRAIFKRDIEANHLKP